jgi:hypothetical protein
VGAHRKFDHDECRALYAAGGWTYRQLAAKYGVSEFAVGYALNPRVRETTRAYQLAHCRRPCAAGCGRDVWTMGRACTGLCRSCSADAKVTSVRDGELKCASCGEWKADDAFPRSSANTRRRQRHKTCTACHTAIKRAWRARHPERERAYDRERKRKQRAAV